MAEPLLIGCWGWDHAEWVADVFPEEMPADWRFCYYSNEHRSVVVPASTWARASADDVAGWVADCDPEFSFVVELPAVLCRPRLGRSDLRQELARFLATLAPAAHLTRAFVVRPLPTDYGWTRRNAEPTWLARLVEALADLAPVAVDADGRPLSAGVARWLADARVSVVWRPERDARPYPWGRFLVALTRGGDLRQLRGTVETMVRWMDARRGGGLYFDDLSTAYRQATQARTLAELLGVS